MTQVVYYVAASLDGFIAGPNGELDWLHAFKTPGNDYGYAPFLAGVDALVMGRSTYETTRSFGDWPYGKRPTWLLTHREASAFAPLPPAVQLSTDSPAQLLAQWQALGLGRVWLVGGGQVAAQFLQAGCLHELMLALMPVTLGRGIALFQPAHRPQPARWERLSATPQALGVQTMHYKISSM
jgi:dihydrofolate reductase